MSRAYVTRAHRATRCKSLQVQGHRHAGQPDPDTECANVHRLIQDVARSHADAQIVCFCDDKGGPRECEGRGNPTEVQPGPEPHRDGLPEAQGAAAQDRRADVRRPLEGRRERLPPVHPAGMHEPSCGDRI